MASAFNPKAFLDTSTDSSFETKRTDVPDNDYPGTISKLEAEEITIQQGKRQGEKAHQLTVFWVVDDQKARDATGLPEPTVRQKLWLDLTPKGELATGKNMNIGLGKLREAVGQNKAGKKWVPSMLIGASALIHVGSRTVNEDKDGNPYPEPKVFVEVTGVAKLGSNAGKKAA